MFLGIRGSNRDITDRKKEEMLTEQLRKELAHVTRVTTARQLAASLAHELNQPLTAILCNAQTAQQLLAPDPPSVAEVREALEDIAQDSERAGGVIRRPRALFNKTGHERSALQLNDIIQEALDLLRSEVVLKGITTQVHLEPALPGILGNRIELQQVVLNLVVNAMEAMTVGVVTSAYKITVGKWAEVREKVEEAKLICEQLGDYRQWGDCTAMLGENALISGDIQYSITIQKELLADARRRRNPLHQGWGLLGIARNQIRLGNPAISIPMLQEALHILDETPNLASLIETNSQLALAYFRLGDKENAAAYARKTLELSENISPTVYSMNLGFAALADACFGLWETALHAQPVTDPEQYKLLTEKALKPIRAFQGVFPIGLPVTPYYQGWYEWLTGKPEAALKAWQRGLDAALKFNMPYEEGLLRVKLGAFLKDDSQKLHFERAIQLFENMGAVHELNLARSEAHKAGFQY